jgi:HD-like signal output (HDOD) protein
VPRTGEPPTTASQPADVPEPLRRLEQAVEVRCASGEHKVPPYPAVALRVQETMGRKGVGLGEVAGLIGADAALAADVLRCANSVMYRRGEPVIDLTQALARIGVQQVMRLLVASGLAGHAQAVGPLVLLRRMVWIEGLASAAVCQELARARGLRAEEAFTLGLLHDFGKIVSISCLEGLVEERKIREAFPRAAWEALVERQHVRMGLHTAARWRLPPLVHEVIAAHHGGQGACSDERLLEVVRLGDAVVKLLLDKAHVSGADLAGVAGLTPAERERLAGVLEHVPDFVAAFETPASAASVATPCIAQPETTLAQPGRPLRLGVSVSVTRRPRLFTSTSVSDAGMVLTGDEPLPENRLLEAKIYAEQPFSLWVLATLCRRDGAGWRVEVQPFALTGELRDLWARLLSSGQAG